MATITKLNSGSWRAQVRRRGQYASRTFILRSDAQRWARDVERRLDLGHALDVPNKDNTTTIGDLISLHIRDMCEVGRAPLRSKSYCLERLARDLGTTTIECLDRSALVAYGRQRAKNGAGPVTLGIELGYLRLIIIHAAAIHGLSLSAEPVDQARTALKRLGLVGKGKARDRRPSPDELARLLAWVDSNPRQSIPIGRIIRFAIATGMRQDEISRLAWADVDRAQRVAVIRNRKHPRIKCENHQVVALVDDTGWDPIALMDEQSCLSEGIGRVFPYNGRSVGTAFRRSCRKLGILDLHFHDLRHEATIRLFEAGYQIPEVALVTGHLDWANLRRYTNLNPQELSSRRVGAKKTA